MVEKVENKECNYHVKSGRQVGDSETTGGADNETVTTIDNNIKLSNYAEHHF